MKESSLCLEMIVEKNLKYLTWEKSGERLGVITFFTPTFNRASLLGRVYNCLRNQTNTHFIWIVVNDGSCDNTNDVVRAIMLENSFPILYIVKDNGGKHSAFKAAFQFAETEFFSCLDDDDIPAADCGVFHALSVDTQHKRIVPHAVKKHRRNRERILSVFFRHDRNACGDFSEQGKRVDMILFPRRNRVRSFFIGVDKQ